MLTRNIKTLETNREVMEHLISNAHRRMAVNGVKQDDYTIQSKINVSEIYSRGFINVSVYDHDGGLLYSCGYPCVEDIMSNAINMIEKINAMPVAA